MNQLEGEKDRVLSNIDSATRRIREVIPYAPDYAGDDPKFDEALDDFIRFADRLAALCRRDPVSMPHDPWFVKKPAPVHPKHFQWPSPIGETPVFVREGRTGKFDAEKWWKENAFQSENEEPFDEEDWGVAPTPIVRGITDRELIDELVHRGYSLPPEWVEDKSWPGNPSDPDGPFK